MMTPRIERTLGRFHHRFDCRLFGMQPNQDIEGIWEYPPLDAEMVAMGLEDVEAHVFIHQNTINHYIATCPVLEICLVVKRRPVELVTQ